MIPEKYRLKTIKVTIPGVIAFAWSKDLLLEFISDQISNDFAIIGGDVITTKNSKMSYTYDSWSSDPRTLNESLNEYRKRCSGTAREYIEKYPVTDDILFIPVITSETTTGMSHI